MKKHFISEGSRSLIEISFDRDDKVSFIELVPIVSAPKVSSLVYLLMWVFGVDDLDRLKEALVKIVKETSWRGLVRFYQRSGMSGACDYVLEILRSSEKGFYQRYSIHVSMYGKLNSGLKLPFPELCALTLKFMDELGFKDPVVGDVVEFPDLEDFKPIFDWLEIDFGSSIEDTLYEDRT